MKAQRLEALPAAAPLRSAARTPAGILAQRHSTLGGGSATAPPVLDSGRPLEPATRHEMERGFGQDFGAIRVHDDARAHDNARSLGAIAYAAGNDIVFGEGRYAPQTSAGRGLIAHELAHSVQQGGVQMKADGPLPIGADARLEAEADRAALAVTAGRPVPGLSRIGAPAVFRAATPPPANLPPWVTATVDDDLSDGSPTELIVCMEHLDLKVEEFEKGAGLWVEDAYKRTDFASTIYTADQKSAFKEQAGSSAYQDMWLRKFGFTSFASLSKAIKDRKGKNQKVTDAYATTGFGSYVTKLAEGLRPSSSAIDHIIEKHMGGTSVPSNLQLFDHVRNSTAGSISWRKIAGLAAEVTAPGMRGASAKKVQIRSKRVSVLYPGPKGPTFEVETLLRDGDVAGTDAVKRAAEGHPVHLRAGVNDAVADIKDEGSTFVETSAARVVSGALLIKYERGPQGKSSKTDHVAGVLDHRAFKIRPPNHKDIIFTASIAPAAADGTPAGDGDSGGAGSELRRLAVAPGPQKIPFEYLYLSPGYLVWAGLNGDGQLIGEGVISPGFAFVRDIRIRLTPALEAVADLKPDNLRSPASYFRVTDASIALQLSPKFVPNGDAKFEIGPVGRPVVKGVVHARYNDGAFIARGELEPARKIVGLEEASGGVEYHSRKGWSGNLDSTWNGPLGASARLTLGFTQEGDKLKPYAHGKMGLTIKGIGLQAEASWDGGDLTYSGSAVIPNPIRGVKSVRLHAIYANGALRATGEATLDWAKQRATAKINYVCKDGERSGHFSGSANVVLTGDKLSGAFTLKLDEDGPTSASGRLSYQISERIRPTLDVAIDERKRLKLSGNAEVGDLTIVEKWPKKPARHTLFDDKLDYKIQLLYGAADLFVGGAGHIYLGYSLGPVLLTTVTFSGSLYPLEPDPAIEGTLSGTIVAKGDAGLHGLLDMHIGAELLQGAAGVKGSLGLGAGLHFEAHASVAPAVEYRNGFTVSAEAYFDSGLELNVGIVAAAEVYTLWGYGPGHEWTFPIKSMKWPIGSGFKLPLGTFTYSGGQRTEPKADAKSVPEKLDPADMVKYILERGSTGHEVREPAVNYYPRFRR
jgi:hypothetical protein